MSDRRPRLRIAVDFQSSEGRRTGIGVAAVELVAALRATAPELDLACYVTGESRDLNACGRVLWESARIPFRTLRDKPDLVWSPGFAPAFWTSAPQIVTVHDLIGMIYPQNLTLSGKAYWSYWLPACVKRAKVLVASSESTRQDIGRLLGRDIADIKVVPLAASEAYYPIDDTAILDAIRNQYGLKGEYLLAVGTLEPRKNVPTLIRSFKKFRAKRPNGPRLALIGKCGGESGSIARLIRELDLADEVSLLGYIPDEDMNALYNASLGYVLVSTYEGFGLPVLEAMQCSTPVVTANTASLPEIVGSAAILAEPQAESLAAGVMQIHMLSKTARQKVISGGLSHAKTFSWKKTAQATIEVYQKVLGT